MHAGQRQQHLTSKWQIMPFVELRKEVLSFLHRLFLSYTFSGLNPNCRPYSYLNGLNYHINSAHCPQRIDCFCLKFWNNKWFAHFGSAVKASASAHAGFLFWPNVCKCPETKTAGFYFSNLYASQLVLLTTRLLVPTWLVIGLYIKNEFAGYVAW